MIDIVRELKIAARLKRDEHDYAMYDLLAGAIAEIERLSPSNVGVKVGVENQSYIDAAAAIEGVAQELEAIDRFASAKMLRDACDALLDMPPAIDLPPADDETKRIVARALDRFKSGTQTQAARDVLAERGRQVQAEGWTTAHDDEHDKGEMARAAGCYALLAGGIDPPMSRAWPWSREWWKPGRSRQMLVKAAALILAEIERQDRASKPKPELGGSGRPVARNDFRYTD